MHKRMTPVVLTLFSVCFLSAPAISTAKMINPNSKRPRNGPNPVLITDGSTVHNIGELHLHITNWGMAGSMPGSGSPFAGAPSAEWPAGSGIEHLYAAGLWVGALRAGIPAVSTSVYEAEFRPTQDPIDIMYRAKEGDPGGDRRPFPSADDDGDGLVDEDPLDGRDNDGDGMIDEDFAAISDQMLSCWYTDNQPEAINMYPNHNPLNIMVRQESFQWENDDFDDFVGVEYTITNIGTEVLSDVYIGIFADVDIGSRGTANYWEDDATGFFSSPAVCTPVGATPVDVAYSYDADGDGGMTPSYFGVMILDHPTDPSGLNAPVEVGISTYTNFIGTAPYLGGDPTNDFERYEVMSKQTIERDAATPRDYRMLVTVGPFRELLPESSLVVRAAFCAGNGMDGLIQNAARARLAFKGKWFNIDGNPHTGVAGRETPVAGPAEDVVIDSCRPGLDDPVDVPAGETVWVNSDCEAETLLAVTCNYLPGDSLLYRTGVDGRETNVRWTITSEESSATRLVFMDIKPGAFPNPLNIKKNKGRHKKEKKHKKGGVLPVAILGQAGFSPEEVDVSTVRLEGVAPIGDKQKLEDVASPSASESCPFTSSDHDGFDDLVLKFSKEDLAAKIRSEYEPHPGSVLELKLTGSLKDGTTFEAFDCVKIVKKKHKKDDEGPRLEPPRPNPFNPVSSVSYYLTESSRIRLAVYDVSGRLVEVLQEGSRPAGLNNVVWDGSRLASGIYFLKLEANGKTVVRKAVLLR